MSTKTKAVNAVDLFAIDPVAACQEGTDLELEHPGEKEPLGVFLVIVGQESDEFKNLVRQMSREGSAKGFRQKSEEERVEQAVEDLLSKKNAIRTASACTKGWWRYEGRDEVTGKGFGRIETMYFEGEELPFSPENAKRVFTTRPWTAEQANAGIGNLGKFMKRQSAS